MPTITRGDLVGLAAIVKMCNDGMIPGPSAGMKWLLEDLEEEIAKTFNGVNEVDFIIKIENGG